jgi:hypothetical protein
MGGSVRPDDPWAILGPATKDDPWGILPSTAAAGTARLDAPFIDALDGLTAGRPRLPDRPGRFRPSNTEQDRAREAARVEGVQRARGAAVDATLGKFGGAVARGLAGGISTVGSAIQNVQEDIADANQAMGAYTPTRPSLNTEGRDLRAFGDRMRERLGTGTVPQRYGDVRGVADALDYAKGAIGNTLASVAPGLAATAITRRPMIGNALITAQQVGETRQNLEDAKSRQAGFAGEYDEYGSPIMEPVPAFSRRDRTVSSLVGGLTAIPDQVLPARIGRNLGLQGMRDLATDAAEAQAKAVARQARLQNSALGRFLLRVEGNAAGRVALETVKGAAEEAPTEFLQELGTGGLAPALAGYDVDGKKLLADALEGGVQGAIGGGALRGGSRALPEAKNAALDAIAMRRERRLAQQMVATTEPPTGAPDAAPAATTPPGTTENPATAPIEPPAPAVDPTPAQAQRRAQIEQTIAQGGLAPDELAALRSELEQLPPPIAPTAEAPPVSRGTIDGSAPVEQAQPAPAETPAPQPTPDPVTATGEAPAVVTPPSDSAPAAKAPRIPTAQLPRPSEAQLRRASMLRRLEENGAALTEDERAELVEVEGMESAIEASRDQDEADAFAAAQAKYGNLPEGDLYSAFDAQDDAAAIAQDALAEKRRELLGDKRKLTKKQEEALRATPEYAAYEEAKAVAEAMRTEISRRRRDATPFTPEEEAEREALNAQWDSRFDDDGSFDDESFPAMRRDTLNWRYQRQNRETIPDPPDNTPGRWGWDADAQSWEDKGASQVGAPLSPDERAELDRLVRRDDDSSLDMTDEEHDRLDELLGRRYLTEARGEPLADDERAELASLTAQRDAGEFDYRGTEPEAVKQRKRDAESRWRELNTRKSIPARGRTDSQASQGSPKAVSGTQGRTQRTIIGDEKVQTRYEVREASGLTPSHNPFTFLPSQGYPEGVQGRDLRQDSGAQQNIVRNAQRNDPDRGLDPTVMAGAGPATVTRGGVAVAGNGRLMSLIRAITEFPSRYADYRALLIERAQEFGLDPQVVAGMQNPVLVRVLDDAAVNDEDVATLQRLNRKSDETETKAKRGTDEAAASSSQLQRSEKILEHLAETFDADGTVAEYLDTSAGREFLMMLVNANIIQKERLGQLVRGEGTTMRLTAEGKLFVQRMLLATALNGDGALLDAMPSALLNKVERAAPSLLITQAIEGWNVTSRVQAAVRLLVAVSESGKSLTDYVTAQHSQQNLDGEIDYIPADVLRWATFLHTAKPTAVGQQFRVYATRAQRVRDIRRDNEQAMPGMERPEPFDADAEAGRLGAAEELAPPSAAQRLLALVPSANDTAKRAQADLFGDPEPAPDNALAYDAERAKRDSSYRSAWATLQNPSMRREMERGRPSQAWLDAFSYVRGTDAKMLPDEAQVRQALSRGRQGGIGSSDDQGMLTLEDQVAYHGSPYRFAKFLMSKIGAGEGAQVYGWGLYFASRLSIARHYFRALGLSFKVGPRTFRRDAMAFDVLADAYESGYDKTVASVREQIEGVDAELQVLNEELLAQRDEASRFAVQRRMAEPGARREKLRAGLSVLQELGSDEALRKAAVRPPNKQGPADLFGSSGTEPGQLYQVTVPDDDVLLDWEAPLASQPEAVRRALRTVWASVDRTWEDDLIDYDEMTSNGVPMTGRDLYKMLVRALEEDVVAPELLSPGVEDAVVNGQPDKAASLLLLDHGVRGLRYLDATSRGSAKDKSHNFVIFSEDDVAIAQTLYERSRRSRKDPDQLGLFSTVPQLPPQTMLVPVDPEQAPKDVPAAGGPSTVYQAQTAEAQRSAAIGRMSQLIQRLRTWFSATGQAQSPEAPSRFAPIAARNDAAGVFAGTRYLSFSLDFLHALHTNAAISLVGQKIGSEADLAVLAQALRDPAVETGRMFVLDAEGNIIAHEATSLGVVGATTWLPGWLEQDPAVQAVLKNKAAPGGAWAVLKARYPTAASVYVLHNHPSGSPVPSLGDLTGMLSAKKLFGDAVRGSLVIDSGEYGFIPPSVSSLDYLAFSLKSFDKQLVALHSEYVRPVPGAPAQDPLYTVEPGFDMPAARQYGNIVSGGTITELPLSIVAAAKEVYEDTQTATVVFLSSLGEVRAVVVLPPNVRSDPWTLRSWVLNYGKATGGTRALLVTPDRKLGEIFTQSATSGVGAVILPTTQDLFETAGPAILLGGVEDRIPELAENPHAIGRHDAVLAEPDASPGRSLRSRVDRFWRGAASLGWLDKLMRRTNAGLKSLQPFDPDVEKRIKESEGLTPSMKARVRAATEWLKRAREAIPALGRPSRDTETAIVNELLLMMRRIPAHSQRLAADFLVDATDGLSREEVDLMTRALILDDLLKDLDAGKYTMEGNHEVPFFGRDADDNRLSPSAARARIEEAQAKNDAAMARKPAIGPAMVRLRAKRRALVQQLVDQGMLQPEVLDDERYYHRQVLEYARAIEAGEVRPNRSVRQRVRGFQRKRTGGGEFNTLFVESEFEWIAQAYEKLILHGIQERVRAVSDRAPEMRRRARDRNRVTFYMKVEPLIQDYLAGRPVPSWLSELLPDPSTIGPSMFSAFGSPVDPLAPFRQRIAIATQSVYNGVSAGSYRIAELTHYAGMLRQLERWIDAGAEGLFDHPQWFKFLSALAALDLPESASANGIFKAMRERDQLIETVNGDAHRSWRQEAADEGLELWQREKGQVVYSALSITEEAVDQVLSGERDLDPEDINEIKAMGGPKEQWAVAPHIADALDDPTAGLGTMGPYSLERPWMRGMAAWKYWQLYRPARIVKYNLNNMAGDADVSFLHPGIFRYAKKALADVRAESQGVTKVPPALREELRMWQRHGAVDSGFAAAEVSQVWDLKELDHLVDPNPLLVMRIMGAYWQRAESITRVRENVLRLAAARYFEAQLRAKGLTTFAASNPKIIRALWNGGNKNDRVQVVAARLARDLIGDYQSVSAAGSWVRNRIMPFFSWQEINAKRYFWAFRNITQQPEGKTKAIAGLAGAVVSRAAVGTAKLGARALSLAVKVHAFYALVSLYNRIFWPEEEEELRRDGRGLHLIYGRDDDGTIRWLRLESAWGALLKYAALEDFPADIRDLREGKTTWKDMASEAAWATPKQAILQWEPVTKGLVEGVAGISLFPDPFNPRPLKERARDWMVSQGVGVVNDLYRTVTGELIPPSRPGVTDANTIGEAFSRTVDTFAGNRTDPGEAAYWLARQRVSDFLEKKKGESAPRRLNDQQLALYYFKAASRWEQPDKADQWLRRYYEKGGKPSGVTSSLKNADPLASLPQKYTGEFMRTLSQRDRELVQQARAWWRADQRKPAQQARRRVSFSEVRKQVRERDK